MRKDNYFATQHSAARNWLGRKALPHYSSAGMYAPASGGALRLAAALALCAAGDNGCAGSTLVAGTCGAGHGCKVKA